MNAETLNSVLENRTLWISVGLLAFFLWNNRKSSKPAEPKSKNVEQASKNDAKLEVTQDIENTDDDWADSTPSINEGAQNDAFSESVKQESDSYASESNGNDNYKNGVDI